jgi:hypothetical protein
MTLEVVTPGQFARDLQLIDEAGALSDAALANVLRAPLTRWGLSPRRTILRYAREQLIAAEIDGASDVSRVLDRLLALGECDEVYIGHERYVVPAEPRWISTTDGVAVFLSASALPADINRLGTSSTQDIAQRIQVKSEDDLDQLQLAGIRQISIEEWLSPLHMLGHATRRMRQTVRSDEITLIRFWEMLLAGLADEGLPLSAEAELRVLTGPPGDFFGHHDAVAVEGRWATTPPDGEWCAFRRGYGEKHWHPVIVSVDGENRRALDLFDRDEWHWALLARGRKNGSDELVTHANGTLQTTFPAPLQMQCAMDLFGVRRGPWTWEWPPGAPDLWALLK